MKYTIEIAPAVVKKLKRFPRTDQVRLYEKIASLADDPRPHGYGSGSNRGFSLQLCSR